MEAHEKCPRLFTESDHAELQATHWSVIAVGRVTHYVQWRRMTKAVDPNKIPEKKMKHIQLHR